ncbi:MBL fold metallo-hydrolase [Reinekea blandensis]|uniref:Beta-lactamase-like protein n=1 Tax=Reinekea blandensis MED297 TaxID=314283 RepID=A4BH13_9GAMM|nr:MBL fold metallo-hydrolase [Reinekea blandensis]EAR08512.1 Beta-lactamase-like protein [Reinekea sp. MED297] [Reinekea blandensis MED297]
MASTAQVKTFFDPATFTYTHVVTDPATKATAIIDSVLDYDPKSGRTSTASADEVIAYVKAEDLKVEWILETHVHADHLSAAPYLKSHLGGKTGIGKQIGTVQKVFKSIFNAEDTFKTDGSQFDIQFDEGDTFQVGELNGYVMHTPGHTPACSTYVIDEEHAFVGDTIFMPDQGTARCDFPGGDATVLFNSVKRILSLPDSTKLYMCHDYGPNGRDYQYLTTVKEERERNIHVNEGVSVDEFVQMRSERDATLDMPVLILPSVQVNMRAGEMPPKEDNGTSYIKVPLNAL